MKIFKLVLFVVFIAFMCFFTVFYVGKESGIYPCDYVEYNMTYYDYAKLLLSDFHSFIVQFAHEVSNYNRSPFLNIFLIPFYYIFKESRTGYIIAINLVFMLPVMLMTYKIFSFAFNTEKKSDENKTKKHAFTDIIVYFSIASVIFLYPSLWHPALAGIPDICGMLPLLVVFYLYLKHGNDKKFNFKNLLTAAGLLYLSFLCRRWYFLVVASFFASIFIENIISSVVNFKNIKEFLKKNLMCFVRLASLSLIIGVFALIFQFGYVSNIISAETAERAIFTVDYNQWKVILFDNIGWVYLFFAILGLIFNFRNKLIRVAFFALITYLFLYTVIMHNQLLWINHNLFPAGMLVIIIASGIFRVIGLIKNNVLKVAFCTFVFLYALTDFVFYFLPANIAGADKIYTLSKSYPRVIPDSAEIKDLYTFLEDKYKDDNQIKVAIYGLNTAIGYWQFRSINPKSEFAKNNVMFETVTDDDFYAREINADYVLIFEPLGLFFDDLSIARVITDTRDMFLNNEGIAQNYSLIREFKLHDENNTNIRLYKLNKPLSKEQIKEYFEHFYEYYPEWRGREEFTSLYQN